MADKQQADLVASSKEGSEASRPALPALLGVSDVIQGCPPLLHEGALQQGLQLLCLALPLRAIVQAAELEGEVHLLRILLSQSLWAKGTVRQKPGVSVACIDNGVCSLEGKKENCSAQLNVSTCKAK